MELNDEVLRLIKSYPTNGVYGYDWPRGGSGSFDGVTKDLVYKNTKIARAREDNKTYCCGLTFEVWFTVAIEAGIDLVSAANAKRIKSDWFVATGKRRGCVDALVPRQFGIQIPTLSEAKPGDFIQFWRQNGSGHSVILVDHTPTTLMYWSTQPVTKGIGIHTEVHGREEFKSNITDIYIVRATI